MTRFFILSSLFILLSCSESVVDVSGTYTSDEIQLKLENSGKQVSGTLTQNGNEYPIKGEVEGNSVSGSFKVGEDSFSFIAETSATSMSLTTGETKYELSKKASSNPLTKNKKNPLTKTATPAVKNTKTYQIKDSFIYFDYPKEWTVRTHENFLTIEPHNAKKDAKGEADEFIMFTVTPANGIELQSDVVKQFFTQLVNQQFNNTAVLKESGASKSELGPGRTFKFAVKGDEGKSSTVMIYCSILDNVTFYIEHAAINEYYDERVKDAELIFSTLRFKKPEKNKPKKAVTISGDRDPQIVSRWIHRSNAGNGVVYTESSTKAVFRADGKVFWGSGTIVSADNGQSSMISKPGQNPPDEGVWTTKDGVIHITWSNGNKSQYQYLVFEHNDDLAIKMIIHGEKLYFKRY